MATTARDNVYLKLVRAFPLRPIRSDSELKRATTIIDELIDRDELSPGEQDYLDVLGDLVEKYELEHHPIEPADDADMLRYLLETRERTQSEVAAETGIAESTISEVLAGKRKLNRRHIAALARFFKIDPAAFMAE